MMELGLRLAQICDKAIGGQELERSLLESGTAKGRLIHYHSTLDGVIIRENGKKKGSASKKAHCRKEREHPVRSEQNELEDFYLAANRYEVGSHGNGANQWQQWHYDYGIFTVLTAPMFLRPYCLSETFIAGQLPISCDQECPYPNGHSCLQIFDPKKSKVLMVKTSPEKFIIQVGESADILSKGKLHSTLHRVCKPRNLKNLSRETFVVFLQPAWSKTFSLSDNAIKSCMLGDEKGTLSEENNQHDLNGFAQEVLKTVPRLASRLKDGMTFAEFSRATTKQYYGGSGLQSNR
uniref:Fe2OG dioxygenase domain-containing protein n=1 Tax=Rhizophora mucronata TaxID=61149 RepID=A0A2P2P1P6_RHIMU